MKTLTEIMKMLDSGHTITLRRHWNSDTVSIAIEHKPHGPCTLHTGLDNFYGLDWCYPYDRLAWLGAEKTGDKMLQSLEDLVNEFFKSIKEHCVEVNPVDKPVV